MNKNIDKHGRIKNLTYGAIARGDVVSCDRQPDDTYIIILASDMTPVTHTAVGVGTLLYLPSDYNILP